MAIVLTKKAEQLLAKCPDERLPVDSDLIERLARTAYEFHYGETVERKTACPWAKLPREYKEHWCRLVKLIRR